ncbi:MAG: M48 family metallopeptidase [Candidatus Gracilibacteria bacterium]|nr:M48 family metallopeptidase [bacterium]MDZ4216690.1 M48 family metallopeptidase [Candidatus Gracilibacteria bacterium]
MNIYQQISSNNRQTVLILLLFTAVVLGIAFVAFLFLEVPTELFPSVSLAIFGIIFVWTLISYYWGDKMILSFVGAKPISRQSHFDVYNLVENLSITAGLPNPTVYVIEDDSLNAFATGRNPKHSVVCLTTGIVKKLNKRQLEAVIAHEMGHIANYDIRLQLILITVVGLIAMTGEILMRVRGKNTGSIALAGLVIYIIGAPLLRLISLALSRNREYLADATGSFYTRDPEALAEALQEISKDSRVESADRMNSAAHLFIENPKKEPDLDSPKKIKGQSFLTRITSTHPPILERIKRLKGHE